MLKKYFFIIKYICILWLVIWWSIWTLSTVDASMNADYDTGWIENTDESRLEHTPSWIWNTLAGGHAVQNISIDPTAWVKWAAAKIDIVGYWDDGLFKIWTTYNENRFVTLDASKNTNRMVLYTTILTQVTETSIHFILVHTLKTQLLLLRHQM